MLVSKVSTVSWRLILILYLGVMLYAISFSTVPRYMSWDIVWLVSIRAVTLLPICVIGIWLYEKAISLNIVSRIWVIVAAGFFLGYEIFGIFLAIQISVP